MFTGFISRKSSIDNLTQVSNKLFFLGTTEKINPNFAVFKKSETFYVQKTELTILKKENGDFIINFSFSFNPNFLSWILGRCLCPLGLVMCLIPSKEKDDFEIFLRSFEI